MNAKTSSLQLNARTIIFLIFLLFAQFQFILVPLSIPKSLSPTINSPLSSSMADDFNATLAYQHIQTQLLYGYRIPGTTSSHDCVDWIHSHMELYGESQIIDYTINSRSCKNVLGKIGNDSPKDKILVLGAHFDSRAVAEKDPDPDVRGNPIPGANDGASGVAVLLEIARVLSRSNVNLNCEVWFFFFDAEDQGESQGTYGLSGWDWCEGSIWQAQDLKNNPDRYFSASQSITTIDAFVLLDMVGGTGLKFKLVSPYNNQLYEDIFETGRNLGYQEQFPLGQSPVSIVDDHVAFHNLGIPSLDLIIEFWGASEPWSYHHTQSDNIDNIDPNSLNVTGRTVLEFAGTNYASSSDAGDPDRSYRDNENIDSNLWDEFAVKFVTYLSVGVVSFVLLFRWYQRRKFLKREKK